MMSRAVSSPAILYRTSDTALNLMINCQNRKNIWNNCPDGGRRMRQGIKIVLKNRFGRKIEKMKDKGKIRDSILSAAAGLFEQYGYEKTTMDEIAAASHKAKASIYYHFDSKIDIFKAVLRQEMEDVIRHMSEIVGKYPEQKSQITAYLKARTDAIRYARVFYRHIMSLYMDRSGEVKEAMEEARKIFDDWEYGYFVQACNKGRETGILSKAVQPEAFGNTMLVILKGLEIQFKNYEDQEALRSTYDAIIDILVTNNFRQE